MAKGWTTIRNDNQGNTGKTNFRAFDKLIRNTKTLSVAELKKASNEAYDKRIAEEDKLIAAVKDGRATKPEQIERAKAIESARAKAKKEKKEKSAETKAE